MALRLGDNHSRGNAGVDIERVAPALRFASKKYWKEITGGLKEIYQAKTAAEAGARFDDFAQRWEAIYPAMIQSLRNSWGEFVPFLDFPIEIRKLIYTTNAIESLNARFRAATRRRGHFRTNNQR